jgi:hypothetical protein
MTTLTADFVAAPARFWRRRAVPSPRVETGPSRRLPADRVLRVERPLGQTVRCVEGCVWLTFDGDSRDVVLEAGSEHRCDRNARLLVQAIGGEARLRID